MKKERERGSLVVEASIVFPVMFLVIFFMIFAGNAYLQKCRVEAIVNQCTIDGAAYCTDPHLQGVESGSLPSLGSLEVYPYRMFSSTGAGDVEGTIEAMIQDRVSKMSTGLFSGMKPTNFDVKANYSGGILYASFSVEVSYRIRIPVRLLGDSENIHLEVSTYVEAPASSPAELIRNVDMIWHYLERAGIQEFIGKVKEALNSFDFP